MTGPEHYREAERLIAEIPRAGLPHEDIAMIQQAAQVHATLAVAAAFVDGPAVMRPGDRDEWDRATGRLEDDPEVTR